MSSSSLPDIEGDKVLIRQLFTNLIGNSIKYRDADKPLKITFENVGEGLKSGENVTDNGIGLAICSTICDKHKWRLSVDSKQGMGSTFIIDFQD